MSKEELQETLFNTFPRRRIRNSFINHHENKYMECILCKKQIKISELEHKCECRKVRLMINAYTF